MKWDRDPTFEEEQDANQKTWEWIADGGKLGDFDQDQDEQEEEGNDK